MSIRLTHKTVLDKEFFEFPHGNYFQYFYHYRSFAPVAIIIMEYTLAVVNKTRSVSLSTAIGLQYKFTKKLHINQVLKLNTNSSKLVHPFAAEDINYHQTHYSMETYDKLKKLINNNFAIELE